MGIEKYLSQFKIAAKQLDKKILQEKQLEVATGMVLDAAFLKLYKRSWATPGADPLTAASRIFFSVWINESGEKAQKIYYNIHALKLRKLTGYSIESRKFADHFRAGFKKFESEWQNVSIKFGPLTLMEGWVSIDTKNFQAEIVELAGKFLEIEYLVDKTLLKFKK